MNKWLPLQMQKINKGSLPVSRGVQWVWMNPPQDLNPSTEKAAYRFGISLVLIARRNELL